MSADDKTRANHNNMCLDVKGQDSSQNAAHIVIRNGDQFSETFVKREDGRIGLGYNPNMCLDVAGINTYRNGQNIQTGRCSEVTEKFRFLGASVLAYDDNSTEPWATITAPDFTQGAFTATFAFGQNVTGFALADIGLTGGTATALNPASGAGNASTTAVTRTINADTTAPSVTISAPASHDGRAFTVTLTFSEAIRGLWQFENSVRSISVTGGRATNLRAISGTIDRTCNPLLCQYEGIGSRFAVTVTPNNASTEVRLDVNAGAVSDDARNPNTAATTVTVAAGS